MPWIFSTNIKGPPGDPGPKGDDGMTKVFISDTPPPDPLHGYLWWESDSGNMFIYFDDGNSSQWVQTNVVINNLALLSEVAALQATVTTLQEQVATLMGA